MFRWNSTIAGKRVVACIGLVMLFTACADSQDLSGKTPKGNSTSSILSLGNGIEILEGEIEVQIGDYFEDQHFETEYYLKSSLDGSRTQLHFSQHRNLSWLKTGQTIRVQGNHFLDAMEVHSIQDAIDPAPFLFSSNLESSITASIERSIVIIRTSFLGLPDPPHLTANEIITKMDHTNQIYMQGTNDVITFDTDLANDGTPDVYDVTIDATLSPGTCNGNTTSSWNQKAAEALMANHGVNYQDYHNVMVITPYMPTICGGLGGRASLGSPSNPGPLFSIIVWSFGNPGQTIVIPHELGHNVGLHHAAIDENGNGQIESNESYLDHSCTMGNDRQSIPFNSIHRENLGAYSGFPNSNPVVGSGTHTLFSLNRSPDQVSGPQVLKVPIPNSSQNLHVSLRRAADDLDSNMKSEYHNVLSIHVAAANNPSFTVLVATLSVGQTFSINSNNKITHTSLNNAQGSAEVEILSSLGPQPNQIPSTADQNTIAFEDTPKNINLLYQDYDSAPGPYTFSVVQQPLHGSLSGPGSNRTYTPNLGFTGADSFQWKVNDGLDDSNIATFHINVLATTSGNQTPEINLSLNLIDEQVASFDLLYSDPENQIASCMVLFGDGSPAIDCTDSFEHAYKHGNFDTCAEITDAEGLSNSSCVSLTVEASFEIQLKPILATNIPEIEENEAIEISSFLIDKQEVQSSLGEFAVAAKIKANNDVIGIGEKVILPVNFGEIYQFEVEYETTTLSFTLSVSNSGDIKLNNLSKPDSVRFVEGNFTQTGMPLSQLGVGNFSPDRVISSIAFGSCHTGSKGPSLAILFLLGFGLLIRKLIILLRT